MRGSKWWGLALLVLAAGLVGCGNEEAGTTGGSDGGTTGAAKLKIGVILPMTGGQATYGVESWNGLQLAEKDIRAAGAPIDFELILRDENSRPDKAKEHAKTLIETDQVHVLIGSVASTHTRNIFQVARESEVPCITPASTNDRLTIEGGPMTSRICFKDGFQGAVLANFALGQGWKKAAIAYDKGNDYSVGLKDNFKQTFEGAGGTVSLAEFTTEDRDFSNVIQAVASAEPDVIFISGYYEQAGPMIRQASDKWAGIPVIGGDGLDSADLVKLVGDTSAEIYLSSHFAADAPDERVRSFAERYKQEFGQSPGAMAALGYDVLFVLMDAVKRAKDPTDPEQLAAAIAATKDIHGITGTISLDNPERTPVKDAVIVKVEGGLKFHKTIPAK